MSVSSQIDLWMGPLESFKLIPQLGRLFKQVRWSGLSFETLIAPAFLIPEMFNPSVLVKAYEFDISIAQMKSMTILGSLRIGSGPIIKEIRREEGRPAIFDRSERDEIYIGSGHSWHTV